MFRFGFIFVFQFILGFFPIGLVSGQVPGDPPKNDLCSQAIILLPGSRLSDLSNEHATVGPPGPVPVRIPGTCIESFENDMWYQFKTVAGVPYYEIIITTNGCNTPAGLQALLIRSKDCFADHFEYRACANNESMDSISMFLHEPEPGVNYFIYVDGFDGCICSYNIALLVTDKKLTKSDYLAMKWDYEVPEEPDYEPKETESEFINNSYSISWSSTSEEDVDFFLIERVDVEIDPGRASIRGLVDAKSTVVGGSEQYTFTDFNGIRQNGRYCYKIVPVLSTGERKYSENYCFEANIVLSFFVGEVKKTIHKGMYTVTYMNNIKKADYSVSVLDADRKLIKELKLENEPVRDGNITIDMNAFPPGKYYFVMGNGTEMFRREFLVTGD